MCATPVAPWPGGRRTSGHPVHRWAPCRHQLTGSRAPTLNLNLSLNLSLGLGLGLGPAARSRGLRSIPRKTAQAGRSRGMSRGTC